MKINERIFDLAYRDRDMPRFVRLNEWAVSGSRWLVQADVVAVGVFEPGGAVGAHVGVERRVVTP
jgi:hypothetical protein